jgi:hypothetical protein
MKLLSNHSPSKLTSGVFGRCRAKDPLSKSPRYPQCAQSEAVAGPLALLPRFQDPGEPEPIFTGAAALCECRPSTERFEAHKPRYFPHRGSALIRAQEQSVQLDQL